MDQEKAIKVVCSWCDKPFYIRYTMVRPGIDGEGQVRESCLHCANPITVTVPLAYLDPETETQGLKSVRLDEETRETD